jgi:hypothetical protein
MQRFASAHICASALEMPGRAQTQSTMSPQNGVIRPANPLHNEAFVGRELVAQTVLFAAVMRMRIEHRLRLPRFPAQWSSSTHGAPAMHKIAGPLASLCALFTSYARRRNDA